ncbi:unnamed protein product, partial [Meganyctiphanes norvegica]
GDNYMYGYPCGWHNDCSSKGYDYFNELKCENGRCNCTEDAMHGVRYNKKESRFECDSIIFGLFGGSECSSSNTSSCPDNSQCVKNNQNITPYTINKYICVCNKDYIMVSKECREGK